MTHEHDAPNVTHDARSVTHDTQRDPALPPSPAEPSASGHRRQSAAVAEPENLPSTVGAPGAERDEIRADGSTLDAPCRASERGHRRRSDALVRTAVS